MIAGQPDELALLFSRVRRFLACWLVLLAALGLAPVVLAVLLELAALIAWGGGWDGGQLYAHPLALSVFWSYGAVMAGLLLGVPAVLLRQHLVRPDPPFLRLGYLGAAATLFIVEIALHGLEPDWYVTSLYVQVVALVATLIYVALARRFSLFEGDDHKA